MRITKDITILEDGNEFKFRLKQVSAYDLQRWFFKVGCALAESGLFTLPGKLLISLNIEKILAAIGEKGTGFLQNLDPEKSEALISELVFKTAERVNGNALTPVTAEELQNTFYDIRSLIQLEKEVFAINFLKYWHESQLNIPTFPQTEKSTLKRGITVEDLQNQFKTAMQP